MQHDSFVDVAETERSSVCAVLENRSPNSISAAKGRREDTDAILLVRDWKIHG